MQTIAFIASEEADSQVAHYSFRHPKECTQIALDETELVGVVSSSAVGRKHYYHPVRMEITSRSAIGLGCCTTTSYCWFTSAV